MQAPFLAVRQWRGGDPERPAVLIGPPSRERGTHDVVQRFSVGERSDVHEGEGSVVRAWGEGWQG